jgi:hypothetical protein
MLEVMLDPNEAHWAVVAAAVARLGDSVLGPALSRAAIDESATERVGRLLAHLAHRNPGALEEAEARFDDPVTRLCIDAARDSVTEEAILEADFSTRLHEVLEVSQSG